MSYSDLGLPRNLKDGLVLRWGRPADAEEVGVFNVRLHSDNPEEPEEFLANWTHDLMGGAHPTTSASDFTVVVDEKNGGKIVSSMNLISQTWTYDGIPFGFGRPELVATDDDYRRRGLVRAQFEVIHARSAAKGELVQGITGIPWYYRQFGYEMAVELGGSRAFFWGRPGNDKRVDEELYRLRPATPEDLSYLEELYAAHCAGSLLTRRRDWALWQYELFTADRESPYARHVSVVTTDGAMPAGYVEYRLWKNFFSVRELGVLPGHSLRAVGLFLTRALKLQADELNKARQKPIDHVNFNLGVAHPLYQALERELEQQRKPYAWYIRVPDLSAFLQHIAPALAGRLASSGMAGYSGALKLNFYLAQLKVDFKNGKLVGAGPYRPEHFFDADAFFPDLTFLQLLFGYRSLDELNYARADCYADNADAAVLLNALFPKQHSWVVELG